MEGECRTSIMATTVAKRHNIAAPVAESQPGEDEDMRTEFSCPYCYSEYDLATLATHLEDQHCFDSRMAVCPVCSAKAWRDMAGHITLQHGHLYKIHSQNRSRKSSVLSSATLSLLGKELTELHLQALIGNVSSTGTISSSTVESILLSLGYKLPSSEGNDTQQVGSPIQDEKDQSLVHHQPNSRVDLSLKTEECEQRSIQAALRADFVQQIFLSTFMDGR